MSDKIAEIRARHQEGIRAGADADRAYLLAEVESLTRERDEARAEVERLREAIKPLAKLYLWPDDMGENLANVIRQDEDWCEATNEDADSDVFIKRRHIRAARQALEAKP